MTHLLDPVALEARLRRHVKTLAAKPRPPGSEEHRQAAAYIRRHLEQAGFTVEDQPFHYQGHAGLNLLTRTRADERPLFIVGAHYDSLPHTPGADDNASAVAALLELAAWVRPQLKDDAPVRLQLVAYDMEELGLVGSRHHAELLRKAGAKVHGMIALEMLGYVDHRPGSQHLPPDLIGLYPHTANFIGVCGNEASRPLLEHVTAAMKTVESLPVESIAVPGRGELLWQVRLSDHSSFWDVGYPAVMITDTSFFRNPHYHQVTDTPETLDYGFLTRVTLGLGECLRQPWP